MEIVWLGHSSLKLQSNGVTLVTDPYADSVGFAMRRQRADIVTVSRDHPHHADCSSLEGNPRVLNGPGEYDIAGFAISAIGTALGEYEGRRQVNTVFTIRAEGLALCHLGDLSEMLSPKQVEALNPTDILVAPAGGACTLAPAKIAELVNLIGPRVVVPVHYWTEGLRVELEPLEEFMAEMGVSEVARERQLNVTRSSLPRERRVVVLDRLR